MSEEQEDEGTPIPGEMTPAEERASGNGWQPEAEWIEDGKEPACRARPQGCFLLKWASQLR